ncbi:MAG: hypothetical protein JO155_12130, partial [Acidimicrobiia bacterium]|nr:hypothetical protein [Acidimicrobiia bacterium]
MKLGVAEIAVAAGDWVKVWACTSGGAVVGVVVGADVVGADVVDVVLG